ncbi:SDR family oxidoreductase [Carnobacterium gallinarum]|uniref:SDR family oxidoreductase n=1 Tax=Carnobacterium gallinarum TaxID=2749 RepID=UPI000550DE90|nr:SDR family oxidoreductase [Carnobacterium gallinarum]
MSINSGKVVIVMGASSGIGEATVRRLAKEKNKLVIAARRESHLKAIKESLPHAELVYQVADVSKYDEVQKVIELALTTFGKIDVLYNNAGIMPTAPLAAGHREEWQQMLDINITGVLNGIAAVLPIMVKQKSGHIIATDSVAGHVVYPDSAVYCGTKFAVRAIMEGLRQEQHQNNIKSTIISPGAVDTDLYQTISDAATRDAVMKNQQTAGFGLTSEQVADAVAYVIATPDNVSVSDMIIRPTKQPI